MIWVDGIEFRRRAARVILKSRSNAPKYEVMIERRTDLEIVQRLLATHAGAELDLLIVRGRRRIGFEVKRTTAPSVTPLMRAALADLRLDRLDYLNCRGC